MNQVFRDAPARWRQLPLKETVTACRNGTWGEEPHGSNSDIICVRVADLDRRRARVLLDHASLRLIPESFRRGRMLVRGDLLLEKSGGGDQQPVGAVALYDHDAPAVCSNFMARMPVAPGFDPCYLCYLHAALYTLGINRRSIHQTTGIQNLDSDQYLAEIVRIPGLEEQRRVARILDKKTKVIDELIDAKNRLIGCLQEKRRAIISQAVIEGLDRTAPRRPSGFPWLNDVPAHWRVTRLKFVRSGSLLYGANQPASSADHNLPRYIRLTDFSGANALRDDTFQSLDESLARPYLLEDGDILLARSGATVGKALRYRASWGRACFASYLVRFRPDHRQILPDYFAWYTETHAFRQEVRLSTVQATIANLSAERYANFAIPLPPLGEQAAIVAFVNRRAHILDSLISALEQQIEKLCEYRSALVVAMATRGGA
ncbi:MAG TPA: restriction endonuclease subunit S [Bryobacteraceae bacterium]|nr:restriction endonuclease subunit S [Bryobacteraceae bacterium]